jgi:Spy/CpxP family protein refolding chaperone
MKKALMIGIPIAVVALLIVAIPTFGLGRMHHRHSAMMKDFMMYKIDKLEKDLNLNPAQQAKWDTFKNDLSSSIDQRMDKRNEIHTMVEQELAKSDPDFSKVAPLIHGQIDSTAQFAHDMVNRIGELMTDLTPEQKQILSKRIAELHEEHGD